MWPFIRFVFKSASVPIRMLNSRQFDVAIVHFYSTFVGLFMFLTQTKSVSIYSAMYIVTIFAIFTTVHFSLLSVHFLVASMPPKKEDQKKRSRKRKLIDNVTNQPGSEVITTMPIGRAGTSGPYLDRTPPHQGGSQSSGLSVASTPSTHTAQQVIIQLLPFHIIYIYQYQFLLLILNVKIQMKQAWPAMNFYQVTTSSTATSSSGGHFTLGPPFTHAAQMVLLYRASFYISDIIINQYSFLWPFPTSYVHQLLVHRH